MKTKLNRFLSYALTLLMVALAATSTEAQELEWTLAGVSKRGTGFVCDKNSVTIASAGTDLAITFNDTTIKLTPGQPPKTFIQWGVCLLYLNVKIPQGYTIKDHRLNLIGGVLKDLGTHGYLDLVNSFSRRPFPTTSTKGFHVHPLGPLLHMSRRFKPTEALDEPLFELSKSSNIQDSARKKICNLTAQKPADLGYFIQISAGLARKTTKQTAILGIDNVDSNIGIETSVQQCH
jgi:hypothetical protein